MQTLERKAEKENQELKIPVFDLANSESGNLLSEPETLQNSLLQLISKDLDLSSLVIVKLDPDKGKEFRYENKELAEKTYLNQLNKIDFKDNITRGVVFSSGNNVYFGNKDLVESLRNEIFGTQIDHSCRYGSLLVSSCQKSNLIEAEQDKPIKIKIVDSQSSNPAERQEAAKFFTGDCHGKISPSLAKEMNAKHNTPFQFRMTWMDKWKENDNLKTPQSSFIAKGTFLPNKSLTENLGYDIILDRSSIKGIKKDQLNDTIPCGDFELPKLALGNRANAELQKYANSWQFNIWFSKDSLEKDIVPETAKEAEKLASIQSEPLKLNQYLVEQNDKKIKALENSEDENQTKKEESNLIKIIRNDKQGLLNGYPKIVDFQREQVKNIWRNLATKGAIRHDSAMAQPCDNLKPGTITAPHLENGTEVIVTRYPIVSKDNICKYTVDNTQQAAQSLQHYRGCVFIRPDEAMANHQCDFDGDQLIVTPAERFPTIAKEVRKSTDKPEYPIVTKRKKIDYGRPKYQNLKQIAAGIKINSIGYIATLIGKVQSSENDNSGRLKGEEFNAAKTQLLGGLFDALQIEVDSPKSATRYQEHHPEIEKITNKWCEKYPSPLFQHKKDERLYKTAPLPTEGTNNINCIPEQGVNEYWEQSKIEKQELRNFSFLVDPPQNEEELEKWNNTFIPSAQNIKDEYIKSAREIHTSYNEDDRQEQFVKLYERLKEKIVEVFPEKEDRLKLANALLKIETNNRQTKHIAECKKISCNLQSTIEKKKNHAFLTKLDTKDTHIVSIPFVRKVEGTRFIAEEFKNYLDNNNIKYEATVNKDLPMVDFALIDPSEQLIAKLETKFKDNNNDQYIDKKFTINNNTEEGTPLKIIPPKEYTWVQKNESEMTKGSLSLNLFTEEISEKLQNFKVEEIKLVGAKYNDYKEVNFAHPNLKDKTLNLTVGKLDNQNDYRNGSPIVQLNNKNLAMFEQSSAKLPIGSKFQATITQEKNTLVLQVIPESIEIPDNKINEEKTDKKPILENISFQLKRKPKQQNQENNLQDKHKKKKFKINLKIPKNKVNENKEKPKTSQLISSEVTLLLHQSIKERYERENQNTINIDSKGEWKATIHNNNCKIQDSSKTTIFESNLKTDQIITPLSNENSDKFIAKLHTPIQEKTNVKPQNKIKEKQEQLSI